MWSWAAIVLAATPAASAPEAGCSLTVPIKTELSTLDVRGSILGLGLRLDSPKNPPGASAIEKAPPPLTGTSGCATK
jgi:hypothetical protein